MENQIETTDTIKRDCLFWRDDTMENGCSALNSLICKKTNKRCPFYKPLNMRDKKDEN